MGAKDEVEKLICEFADQGIGVLFISSEISEMVRICDRIYVMGNGEIIDEISGCEINEHNITKIIAEKTSEPVLEEKVDMTYRERSWD